jgi:DNA polymerase IV
MTSRRSTKAQKRSLDRLATAPENISPTASSEQLLFSGLHFYFFPNSRTNRARALRIDKATQYGATFCPQWSSKVTHIIMDDGMQYEEFMKYHKDLVSVPENVILINGRYVADCMSYGVILTHNQRLYQVPGRQTVEEARSKLKKVASEPSLSAKATKTTEGPLHRSMTEQAPSGSNIRPYETQEYNSIVDLIGRPTTLRMESLSADCIDPEAPNNTGVYDDDLTAMIGEAKAIAHLVG